MNATTTPMKKSCLKRLLEEKFVNDPSYEIYFQILQLSDENVSGSVERQVKILRDSFSSTEADRAAIYDAIAMIVNFARIGSF